VEGLVPFKMKEEAAHEVRAWDVGAAATLGSLAPTIFEKQDDGLKPGQTGTLWGHR
jgi:hypothetical protein